MLNCYALRVPALWLHFERTVFRTLAALGTRFGPGARRPLHLRIGRRGEDEAVFFLRRQGYTIVARRWRCTEERGDLDLVGWARDGHRQKTLCFIEVKTRTARDLSPPESAVDRDKERSLRGMASAFLRRMPREERESVIVRFDVVSVYLLPSGVEFDLLRDAFDLRPSSRNRSNHRLAS